MLTIRNSSIGIKLANLYRLLAPARRAEIDARSDLFEVINRLRQRWRLRLVLDGLLWTLVLGTTVITACAWFLNEWYFASPAVWLLRLVTIFTLVGLLLHYCVKPLGRQVSNARVALYLEEHEPSLRSIMLSAVDARQSAAQDLSPQLVERLVQQALEACRQVRFGHDVEQRKLQGSASKLGLVLLLIVGLSLWAPLFVSSGVPVLLMPWSKASEYSPYHIELSPGDIEIARGSDQLVSARIVGFDDDDVLLFTSDNDGASWQQTRMVPAGNAGLYETFVFDLNHNLDYHVTAANLQSPTYRIEVADIPAISEIGLRYHFPAYTMLEPEISQGSGDISALRGTRVEVQITPTIDIPGGTLILDQGRRIDLVKSDERGWVGEITVDQNSGYRVELQRASGIAVDASAEFRITALDDKYPGISILSPGRDMKVSMIEEPVMKVRATDDQGIANLELVLTVNGEQEQRIKLMRDEYRLGSNRQIDAEHIVFLEELDLRAGDLISYYVHTEDRAPPTQSRTATSDIFFYQVRPFSLSYQRSEQQGGGGGGAQGGQQQGHLSEQQKQFVVATFKMIRDRDKFEQERYQQNLDLLAKAQSRIRDRVEAIVRRIGSRAIVQLDEKFKIISEELPLAAEAMIEVEKKLKETEIETALASAQIALLHLQRADAAFRDINVSLGNRGGAGAGNNTGFEDLADLFRLEMDKLRHQYETVQRGQQQSSQEVIDETLEKLRELAHRQQQEVERSMRRQNQPLNNGSNSKQLALADELEEIARQLEKLSRNQPNPQLQQSISRMRGAAQAMRRAATNASAGGTDQARQAVEGMREAQRLLDQSRVRQFSEAVEQSLRRAELAEKKQAEIKQEVTRLDNEWGETLRAQLDQLDNHKRALSEELAMLEGELSNLTIDSREQQPQAGQSLKQAVRTSREYRLNDRIGRTRDMVQLEQREHAIENEIEIHNGISKMREHIESALENVGERNERGMERSLDRIRGLARELQFLRQRMSSDATGQGTGTAARGDVANGGDQTIVPELEGIAARASELGQRLLTQGVASGDIDPVLARLNELSKKQSGQDLSALTGLALSALMELDYKLRTQMEEPKYPELLISEPTDLPDDYKKVVAEYFRKLSQP